MTHTQRREGSAFSWRAPIGLTDQYIARIQNLTQSVHSDYLKSEFLTKFVSSDTEPADVRRNAAIRKWLATEMENDATEDRLLTTHEDYHILPRVSWSRFTDWCRAYIRDIIGETPPVESLFGRFSGGASTSRSRAVSTPAGKYVGQAHVTASALPIFVDLVDEFPGWLNAQNPLLLEVVRGNVLFTVPKKTDIDRVACKEPDVNMFLQKGVGSFFRSCLRRSGINLNDQLVNRSLAQIGSRDGTLATLDLSSASDSVTTELVFQLLPETWFTLLDNLRCRVTVIDGVEHRNRMFSSMGNGFTFELESLLFYVLARATAYFTGTPGIISVYGDDIICPTEMSDLLSFVLGWCGFQVNPDKSHTTGPVRESCGGHYWNGVDITPFYLKAPFDDLPSVIHAANQLREWGGLQGLDAGHYRFIFDEEIGDLWRWLVGHIPEGFGGGGDTSFKYQLASTDLPKHRLVPNRKRKRAGPGGYYHWLNVTLGRANPSPDAVVTSSLSSETGTLRRRRAPLHGERTSLLFPWEL